MSKRNSEAHWVELNLRVPFKDIKQLVVQSLNPPPNNFDDGPSIASPHLVHDLIEAQARCQDLERLLKEALEKQKRCVCSVGLKKDKSLLIPPTTHTINRRTS